MISASQKRGLKKLFQQLEILKIESGFCYERDKRFSDYYESIFIMYTVRVFATCKAAYILLENEMFAECRMLIRTAFEATLILHYLLKNRELVDKYKEHSVVQRYIELLEIKSKGFCSPSKNKKFMLDLNKVKRKLYRLKYYKISYGKMNDIQYLIRQIGPIPVSITNIIVFCKQDEPKYFEFVFCGQDLEKLKIILYGNGSKEIHSYFSNVINLSFSDKDAIFYILLLMRAGIVALKEIDSFILDAYGVEHGNLMHLWSQINIP